MRRLLWIVFAALPALAFALPAAAQDAVFRQDFTVLLGDFEAAAQLTVPSVGTGPFPTVILLHGSGPADMDFTYTAPDGTLISAIFRDIADYLPTQGVAVLRYNKRYVTGPGQSDFQRYFGLSLRDLAADASAVLDAARANPLVRADRIFLYGWSEGSVVAAALAAQRPREVAGLIVQGAVARPWRDLFLTQINDVALPFLRTFAPDGLLTRVRLTEAALADGGVVAKLGVVYTLDISYYETGEIHVNRFLDADQDGTLNLDTEFAPRIAEMVDLNLSAQGFLAQYGPERSPLPPVSEQAPLLTLPVLILHGENDANSPVLDAALLLGALMSAGNLDVTLNAYPGLGHTLGPAASLLDDAFRPIERQPMADTAAWVLARS